jgi:hypothetical protein
MITTIHDRLVLIHALNEWRAKCARRYALDVAARHDAWRRHSVAAWAGTELMSL